MKKIFFTTTLILLINFSFCEKQGGPSSKLEDELQLKLEFSKQEKNYQLYIETLIQLSDNYLVQGNFEEARKYGEKALTAAELLNSELLQLSALNSLANINRLKGYYTKAIKQYQQALSLSKEPQHQNLVKVNLANCFLLVNKKSEAQECLNSLAYSPTSIETLLYAVNITNKIGSFQLSEQLLNQAFSQCKDNLKLLCQCYQLQGELCLLQKKYEQAEKMFRKAIFQASVNDNQLKLYQLHWLLAKSLAKQSKNDEAIETYQRVIALVDDLRPTLYSDKNWSELKKTNILYYELATLMVKQVESLPDEKRQQKLRKLSTLMADLKVSELKNYFHDDYIVELQSDSRKIEEVAGKETALIYTVVLDNRQVTILCKSENYQLFSSPLSRAKLHQQVVDLRLLAQVNSPNINKAAERLYNSIMKPIENHLDGITHLLFIPDAPMQQVPWAMLRSNNQFLIERFAISSASGLTLNTPKKFPVDDARSLVVGLTNGLPYVSTELNKINTYFPGKVLTDKELTKENLEFELRNHFYRIVHLATHADFTSNSEQNYLMTGKGPMDMKQLEKWIKMASIREEGIELLTLSACKTAVGDSLNTMGLAGTALRSGAKSVLASLWQVDDKATAFFMTQFYQNLKSGDSKATALQKAQKQLLNNKTYASPYYWAPFTLLGNWQ